MSDMKPTGAKIKLGQKEYGMRFTLNAIDDIQEHFNISIVDLGTLFQDARKQIANLRYLLTVLINEDIACNNDDTGDKTPMLDEKYVGRHLDVSDMNNNTGLIFKAFTDHAPEGNDDPNPASE